MTSWQKALAVVGLVVAALAGGYAICHSAAAAAAQRSADSLAVIERSRDSLAAIADAERARADSIARADTLMASAAERVAAAARALARKDSVAADDAMAELATKTSAADSFPVYRDRIVPAKDREIADLRISADSSRKAADGWHDAYLWQIESSAALWRRLAITDSTNADQRAQLLADAKAMTKVPSPWSKLESAAETGAIGAATTGACAHKLLSVGCIAGAVVIVKRVL
jgi:hypothetical protein